VAFLADRGDFGCNVVFGQCVEAARGRVVAQAVDEHAQARGAVCAQGGFHLGRFGVKQQGKWLAVAGDDEFFARRDPVLHLAGFGTQFSNGHVVHGLFMSSFG